MHSKADSFLYKICPFRVLRSKLSDLFQLKLMLVKKKKRSFSERKHIFKLNLEELKGAGWHDPATEVISKQSTSINRCHMQRKNNMHIHFFQDVTIFSCNIFKLPKTWLTPRLYHHDVILLKVSETHSH